MKRKLILRDYQVPAVEHIMKTPICVLAIAPNGGKTEISIEVISRYLKLNPNNRVLILTHSTNVLLDNYYTRLLEIDLEFNYSKDFESNCNVHLSLPHNDDKINGKYDLIIVDEAHENYLANRVKNIIKKVKPTKQLLLTGTPSKFIYEGGYDIYAIASNEISDKYFAKLNIELVASDYSWMGNYNSQHEVKKGFNFNTDDTRSTLELVMDKLIQRLQTKFKPKEFNHPSFINKAKKWLWTYNKIGKTLITCRTIKQAEIVYDILKKEHKINVALSHSKNDIDSEIITKFKNGEYNVLVVVNRARLGYSDDNLMNIIDMSGTHNPDIIYQMFSRVIRGTPKEEKYFMKVTPKELHNMAMTHISMCAALMLTDKKYLLEYNGRNFNDIKIPVIKRINTKEKSKPYKGTSGGKQNNNNILPEFTYDVIDTFKNVLHNLDNPASIYKTTTIGHVKYTLGFSKKRPKLTFQDILESAIGDLSLIVNSANKSQYKSLSEWRKNKTNDYLTALKNNWLDEICKIQGWEKISFTPNNYWTKERCIEDSKKYKSLSKWRKNSSTSYNKVRKNNWLDEICKIQGWKKSNKKPRGYWTKERCINEAKKYFTSREWGSNSPGSYDKAQERGWLDDCTIHLKSNLHKNTPIEEILNEVKNYDSYKELRKNKALCRRITKKSMTKEVKKIILGNIKGLYTKNECIEDSKKYKSLSEWAKFKRKSTYKSSKENNWLYEICKINKW